MPVFKSSELLSQLKLDAQQILDQVTALRHADRETLNRQPGLHSWSIAQVLAHLNFYSRTYNAKLQEYLANAPVQQPTFKSGWLGNYFTKMMEPKADGAVVNKMSAPKDSRPEDELDGTIVIQEFISHQQELLRLLDQPKDLSVRVPTSISSLVKLRAGDTFRFLVAHQKRHLTQAQRTAKSIGYKW